MVALDDFSEGAMENWGLITYRDSMLLYDEDSSTTRVKESIAKVVCHELAHQVRYICFDHHICVLVVRQSRHDAMVE